MFNLDRSNSFVVKAQFNKPTSRHRVFSAEAFHRNALQLAFLFFLRFELGELFLGVDHVGLLCDAELKKFLLTT
jgi:hypothetical protein